MYVYQYMGSQTNSEPLIILLPFAKMLTEIMHLATQTTVFLRLNASNHQIWAKHIEPQEISMELQGISLHARVHIYQY